MRRLGGTIAIAVTVALAASACGAASSGTPAAPAAPATSSHPGHTATGTPPPAKPLRAGERFVTLTMPEPYKPSVPDGGTDEYRCFLVDPKLASGAFLTGSQFLPQNGSIVHHAIFFRVPPDEVAAARRTDAEAPGEGWRCFGDAGIGDNAAWVSHWAPGTTETLLNAEVGYEMPPGSQMVMQVHYNLLGGDGTDQSSIRLRLTDGKRNLTPLNTEQLGAPIELPCASNESGPLCDRTAAVNDVARRFGEHARGTVDGLNRHCNGGRAPVSGNTQHCDFQMPVAATVYAVAGHMHLLGRSITVDLNPGRPGGRRLLDVPAYNFDDQAIRPLAKPVQIAKGDTLRVTCTHDATLRQKIPQLKTLPARYVVWGEGTSDEMCLGLLIGTVSG